MKRTFALLTSLLLTVFGAALPATQAQIGTLEPTLAGTAVELPGGLRLESAVSEEHLTNPKLDITVRKPVLVGDNRTMLAAFNDEVDRIVKDTVGSFRDEIVQANSVATLPPEIASLGSYIDLNYDIYHVDEALISIKFNVDWYGAGAAHPNTYSMTLNYDLQNAKVLELADLFKPKSKFLEALANYSTERLKEAGVLIFPEGAEPKPENYRSWNISMNGLVINFDDYQVAPHAVGPQQVTVPYSVLQALIRPDGPLMRLIK